MPRRDGVGASAPGTTPFVRARAPSSEPRATLPRQTPLGFLIVAGKVCLGGTNSILGAQR